MRKLTPVFLLTSCVAFAGAAAAHNPQDARSAEAKYGNSAGVYGPLQAPETDNRRALRPVAGEAAGERAHEAHATPKANENRTTVRTGGNARLGRDPLPENVQYTGELRPDGVLIFTPVTLPAPDAVVVVEDPKPDLVLIATEEKSKSEGDKAQKKLKQVPRNTVACDPAQHPGGKLPQECLTKQGTGAAATLSTQGQSGK